MSHSNSEFKAFCRLNCTVATKKARLFSIGDDRSSVFFPKKIINKNDINL